MDIVLAGSTVARALNDDQMGRISIDLSADGTEVGAGTIVIDDPTGGDEIRDGRQAKVSEGIALISDGFIGTQDKGRGNVKAQPAREDIYQIQDANALLYGKRFVSRSRPAETDRARVLAFAGLDLSGVATSWVLNTNTATLPAKKYTGNDWSELMTDVFEATGKLIFIHDKADGTGRCLHSHKETEGHTCGLTISDDPGTAETANTFSLANAIRNRAGGVGNLVNDTYGRDGSNRSSTDSDATSITAHDADGLKHQAIVEFEAKSQAELDAKTAAYTDENKDEIDIYEGDIGPLDQNHLLLIRQGDRITVTCQAVGLSASTIRIAHMTLTIARDESGKPVPGYWIAHLELNEAIRLRPRVSSGSRHVTVNELERATLPVAGVDILGALLATEDFTDAEDQVFLQHSFDVSGEHPQTAHFAGETTPPQGHNLTNNPSPQEAFVGRYYLSHDAPVGAAYARLRCDAYAERYEDDDVPGSPFTIRKGVWGASVPAFGDFAETLYGVSLEARWTASFGGAEDPLAYPLNIWIPIVDGRAQFTLEAGISTAFGSSPKEQHRVFIVSPGAALFPLVDTLFYRLDFYSLGVSPGVGSFVSPVAVGVGDGVSTTFHTPNPYKPGSLSGYVNDGLQEVIETDPENGVYDYAYAPAVGDQARASFVVADTTITGSPVPETGGHLGLSAGTDIQDVGTANAPGTNPEVARDDHVHEGVHSVSKTGSAQLVGDITLTAGTNVTLTQAGNDISIASTGGGGGGSGGWVDMTTWVELDAGRTQMLDASELASITLDTGYVAITTSGNNIDLIPDSGQVVAILSGDGLVFPTLGSDPGSPYDVGQTFYSNAGRLRLNGADGWVDLLWVAASGTSTITSGNTVITVVPGISFDPVDGRSILLTPMNNPTNDPGWFWVNNVGFDTFDINVRANPGASGAIFGWRVVAR